MDYTTLPIGNAKHIVIRRTDDTVEVLCQPQWTFPVGAEPRATTRICRLCETQLGQLLQSSVDPYADPYNYRSGTVLVDENITPINAAMTPERQQCVLDDATDKRAICRAPWRVRVRRFLRLA